jgi:hypothetical protein
MASFTKATTRPYFNISIADLCAVLIQDDDSPLRSEAEDEVIVRTQPDEGQSKAYNSLSRLLSTL